MRRDKRTRRSTGIAAAWLTTLAGAFIALAASPGPLRTTLRDFTLPGSQVGVLVDPLHTAQDCTWCHAGLDPQQEPFTPWAASMMGQSARDPVFRAALAVANQDAPNSGNLCLRCHAPMGWLQGHAAPPDGSALAGSDLEGVSCNFCHRMVDPIYQPGNPTQDPPILAALFLHPTHPNSGNYVVDPHDRRRGPFDLGVSFSFHPFAQSPFHISSRMCATCHDFSNPIYERTAAGDYTLGPLNQASTSDEHSQFPLDRTYSEWSQSAFAQGPVDVGGRFGGNLAAVSSCQDCHMPPTTGRACRYANPRTNLPTHQFNGGNTWVLNAIRNLYPDTVSYLNDDSVADAAARTLSMLQNAADLDVGVAGSSLNIRITNQTGHKLPTGFAEGRRMWINVRFLDGTGALVAERGAYDPATATLAAADTKVYEAQTGLDPTMAAMTGLPHGTGFHFAVNNQWLKDNRIPPRGFTNAGFASVRAAPVASSYADGQYWDDTSFPIPPAAASATVTVYYQTTSKEYIDFLRDANATNADGQTAHDQWAATGMSEPVAMRQTTLRLSCYANCDASTVPPILNVNDFICFQSRFASGDPAANCDGSTVPPMLNVNDFICFQSAFAAGCP